MPQPYLMCGRIARTLVCLVGCVVLLAACDRANTADQASAYDPDSTALTDVLLPSRAYFDEGRYDSAAVLAKAMLDSAQRWHLPSQQVNALNALGRMAQELAQLDSATACYNAAWSIAMVPPRTKRGAS